MGRPPRHEHVVLWGQLIVLAITALFLAGMIEKCHAQDGGGGSLTVTNNSSISIMDRLVQVGDHFVIRHHGSGGIEWDSPSIVSMGPPPKVTLFLPQWSEVPEWAMVGIAMVETSSHWKDGKLIYIDQEDGDDGERGPFQCTPGLFDQLKEPGERFGKLKTDMDFATKFAERCLLYFYQHTGSWSRAVACYNVGLHGSHRRGAIYFAAVKAAWADAQ